MAKLRQVSCGVLLLATKHTTLKTFSYSLCAKLCPFGHVTSSRSVNIKVLHCLMLHSSWNDRSDVVLCRLSAACSDALARFCLISVPWLNL